MSLPARQQRVLDRIERSLHVCEPHLTPMFAVFTKLTGDEEMPRLEELRPRSLPFPAGQCGRRGRDRRSPAPGRPARRAPGCTRCS
jgi:hypothetical protein